MKAITKPSCGLKEISVCLAGGYKRAIITINIVITNYLYEKYEKEAASQTAETNKARGAEMQKLGEDLQKKRDAAMQEFNTKQDAAYAPIEKKFYDAVNKVAKANGWDYIMDANSTAFVIKNGPDATPLVKKELGL